MQQTSATTSNNPLSKKSEALLFIVVLATIGLIFDIAVAQISVFMRNGLNVGRNQ